ncbi:MAG: stimulus-sensing domain-containing protein, partial [Pseudomonadota bacterium]|nr:stimulus-sensing domain-containing protein [Pseudomonadota bacterium]
MTPRQGEGTQRRRRLLARLIGLNMLGLIILAGGFLVLSESRQFLTNAYKQSLEAQARIVAGALSQTVINRNFQFFDPSLFGPMIGGRDGPDWEIREATKIMRQVASVTNARIRLYGRDGALVLDSAHMDRSINVISRALPPLPGTSVRQDWPRRIASAVRGVFRREKPVLTEIS